jgi:osmotically-inducible protein OsmY
MTPNNPDNTINDAAILQEIKKRLEEEPHLDENGITIEVNGGLVLLKGKTDTEEEKYLAQKIAASVPGVSKVENHLHIGFGIANTLSKIVSNISGTADEIEKKNDKKPPGI